MGSMDFLMNNRPMTAREWGIDAGIAALAFGFGCIQLMLAAWNIVMPEEALRRFLGIESVMPHASVFVALALTTLPVALRRRFPWPVFVFVLVAFLALQNAFRGFSLSIVGPMIALFTIADECERSEALAAAGITVVGLLLVVDQRSAASMAFLTRFQNIALVLAAAFAGYAYRTHRENVLATEQRAIEAERTREEEAARRVEQERVRIAREVHDITAHSLSAVSIQAAAAERLIDRDPAAAREAIATVRATAKDALEDIRSMIGVLRQGDDPAETAPTAGTDRLPDVAAFLERAGVETMLDQASYDRSIVPAHVDVALFGIAREAATNIVRHAGAAHASLALSTGDGWARLVVEDDGRGRAHAPEAAAPGGHGIVGMAERARLLGGTFSAGNRPEGGFRVAVAMPLAAGER